MSSKSAAKWKPSKITKVPSIEMIYIDYISFRGSKVVVSMSLKDAESHANDILNSVNECREIIKKRKDLYEKGS